MKFVKLIAVFLAALMLLSVCSFAAPSTTKAEQISDNTAIMKQEFFTFLKRNKISRANVSFAYIDFSREFEFVYNGNKMFESYETLKLPLAYLYYKTLTNGTHHLNEDFGDDNLRTVFMRSLTRDYLSDGGATQLLIERYGGLEAVKRAMYELTYTKVPDSFYTTEQVNANFYLDFLTKYYNEALYGSQDYKNMLITPIKELSPGSYSEKYIYDVKITHRYGLSRTDSDMVDMGIVNTSSPFGFVIRVSGEEDPEEAIALLAEFAYDFNTSYGDLVLSQMTTLPDVPDGEKQTYDGSRTYKTPLMIAIIVSTVFAAAVITIVFIVSENRKKNQDRLD